MIRSSFSLYLKVNVSTLNTLVSRDVVVANFTIVADSILIRTHRYRVAG